MPKTVKAISQEHESWVAKLLHGRCTRGSGTLVNDKGDVLTLTHLVECKYTDGQSRAIKRSEWEKIHQEAHRRGRLPALALRFRGQDRNEDLILISIHDFVELLSFPAGAAVPGRVFH